MQTTVPIAESSEGDTVTHAREACGSGVANADTPDNAAVPEMSRTPAFTALTKSCRECAFINIGRPGSAVESDG